MRFFQKESTPQFFIDDTKDLDIKLRNLDDKKEKKEINFRVVLYQPEIPSNTGNIGRLCVGANTELHIIKPMRFLITDKYLKRAGLDYWDKLDIFFYENIEELFQKYPESSFYFLT